jgi:DNA-directed RNA polymerase
MQVAGIEWTPEMPIEAHPLWEQQVELEREMLVAGAHRVQDMIVTAREKEAMTRTAPLRSLMGAAIPVVIEGIEDYIASYKRQLSRNGGASPLALPYLIALDHPLAAFVAVRTVLDRLTDQKTGLLNIASQIGRSLEHEEKIRKWEEANPKAFWSLQRDLDRKNSTALHRRRVNIHEFNRLMRLPLNWQPWGDEVVLRLGLTLVDILVRYTKWFALIADPEFIRTSKHEAPLVLAPQPALLEWLGRKLEEEEVMHPIYTPTVVPPKRWRTTSDGGYHTPYVRTPKLIRFKAHQETQRSKAHDEYAALDMPLVYQALDMLQEVPWRVNRRVLDVALAAWAQDRGLAGLPLTSERPLPPKPAGMVPNAKTGRDDFPTPQAEKEWKRAASKVYAFNMARLSNGRQTTRIIQVAQQYLDHTFYFPHMLDFRGRMYPIPNALQPQGNDLARGLLLFAKGEPITADNSGADWLAIQLAGCMGVDKVSFEDRIMWVHEREDLWRAIAADPLGTVEEWHDYDDKPWQALAAIFEWVDYLDHEGPEPFVSSLPVMVDGTCNGIQHLSAMMRDERGGASVNLVPGESPRDIYKEVAAALQAHLEGIEAGGGEEGVKAAAWLKLCGRNIPRKLTKRPVMVLPYGGTRTAFFKYVREWLGENDIEQEAFPREEYNQFLTFLVGHLWDACNATLPAAMAVMEWIKACAKAASEGNQPIYWVTPSGFVVRHFYGARKETRIKHLLDGTTHWLRRTTHTDRLDRKEQLQGIAPNFVHSQDGAALVLSIEYAKQAGVKQFVAIHDAYGSVAAHMWTLYKCLREAFVEVHETDTLASFRASCRAVVVDQALHVAVTRGTPGPRATAAMRCNAEATADRMLPPLLPYGNLSLSAVLSSDYFFN